VNDIISEEEQVEAIKKWFKENGTTWLVAICLVLLVIAGHNYYQRIQTQKLHINAANYEKVTSEWMQVMNSLYADQDDTNIRIKAHILQEAEGISEEEALVKARLQVRAELTESAQELMSSQPRSTYSHFMALSLAHLAVAEDRLDAAEDHLQWALKYVRDKALAPLVRLRLARVQTYLKKYSEAQAHLLEEHPVAFNALYEDALGDLFNLQGKRTEAIRHYRAALDSLSAESALSAQLKAKLNDLGERV
jgi:predicted negative regulator of RcsB-dependent stress response